MLGSGFSYIDHLSNSQQLEKRILGKASAMLLHDFCPHASDRNGVFHERKKDLASRRSKMALRKKQRPGACYTSWSRSALIVEELPPPLTPPSCCGGGGPQCSSAHQGQPSRGLKSIMRGEAGPTKQLAGLVGEAEAALATAPSHI